MEAGGGDAARDREVQEEDVEVDLEWKTALDGGDDDEDAFAKLDEADLGYAAHPPLSADAEVTTVMTDPHSHVLDHQHRQQQQQMLRVSAGEAGSAQRFKRKNFSKQLQLICLQRYAQYARDFGRLPDKHETQQLLQQSYLQFLKDGGAADEPRLTPPEFLKLIRNRRREINARAQRPPKLQRKEDEATAARRMAALTPAKRKLQEEHAKIRELIEVIDRAREQAGLIPDQHQRPQRLPLKPQSTVASTNARHHQLQQLYHTSVPLNGVVVAPPSMMESLPPLPPDPHEQMETILQLHHETREVQREIAERMRSISRAIRQHEEHEDLEEPSSASV
ncbi:hypothetical protein BBJ28_00008848 [Nothophytophthora sp. Chile5]|nr:hypothetical protein BBJ28_00008848 [Nothophytophthora sp. Chile5]